MVPRILCRFVYKKIVLSNCPIHRWYIRTLTPIYISLEYRNLINPYRPIEPLFMHIFIAKSVFNKLPNKISIKTFEKLKT